jgi:DNA polymerase-3 subunit gamma/tau
MMQTLANKYRPQTFNDVIEQDAIKSILQEQIKTRTHKNGYLFVAGAGSGKTTIARIFGRELNQHKGSFIEIDGASNNGVDNIREIIDNAKFKALDSEFKIYIIDECHMLSTGAWNAALKLLEEPPTYTIFLFCTTDPQKIPTTILSRLQRYDFRRISFTGIVDRLNHVLACEGGIDQDGIPYGPTCQLEALEYIAKLADGGMRDAITMLDKCLSYCNQLTLEDVVKALGTINYDIMFNLTDAIVHFNVADAINIIEEIHTQGSDIKQFIKQYSYFILDLCKFGIQNNFSKIQIPSFYEKRMKEYSDSSYDWFKILLDSVIKLNADLKWETTPKPLVESTIILLCQDGD